MGYEQKLAKKNTYFSLELCESKSKFWTENFNNKKKGGGKGKND